VPRIPRQKLLLETDAPYLLPRNLTPAPKSRRNEPAYLPHIAAAVAALRGEPLASVAEAATQNAVRLFGLDTY
jgi:TatD DNase family protein